MALISDLLANGPCFSIEMFPPKTPEAEERLVASLRDFEELRPDFVSITYGAGGSTRERTHDLVVQLDKSFPSTPMAHLVCASHTRAQLTGILERYRDAGIENILAIRGDPPRDPSSDLPATELHNAVELVELAKSIAPFCTAVGAHPEGHPDSVDIDSDRRHLAEKLRVADFAITQFFFRIEDYLSMMEDLAALGVDKPVIPGIMPITNTKNVAKMAELTGSAVPPEVIDRVEAVSDNPGDVAKVGVDIACELGEKLLEQGAPGLHVITMNMSSATRSIYENLNLAHRRE